MAEREKVVDCALTERAKKKLARPGSRRGSENTKQSAAEMPDGGETDATGERGVIYLGHVPHGFYEEEMRKYFSQFGTVTKLKLYRSRKVSLTLPLHEVWRTASCVDSPADWAVQRVCLHRV